MLNLDPVAEAQERVTALKRELIGATAQRDRLIKDAYEAGASQYEIAKRIGITKQAVWVAVSRAK